MQSHTISMLLPIDKIDKIDKSVKTYESFLLQYSLIVSSNFIIYELIEKSTEDEIFKLFEKYHGSIDDYGDKEALMLGMMLEDNSPQKNETRGLWLDKFFIAMAHDKKSPKFILSSFINAKEFLLLYAIFEGVLKDSFIRSGTLPEGKFLREKDVISLLRKSLSERDEKFLEQLKIRSPLSNFEELECFWDFYTHFRHLYFHSGGYITKKWLANYKVKQEKLIKSIAGFNCKMSALQLAEEFEELEVIENKMFYVTDKFANIFRNYIVRIMESMYIVEDV